MAAIAVVRLSGPLVEAFAATHLSRRPTIGRCVHGELRDGDQVLDDPVAVLIDAQTLDLSLHGGLWVVESAMNLVRRFGFDIVDQTPPDAADEIEAEMLQALPLAKTRQAVEMLLAQPAAWRAMLASNDNAAMRQAIDDRAMATMLRLPRVAIVGPPNVGKSTLANQLFGREQSIVADLPGTTRDWVGETANLGGLAVLLIDTPGRRMSDDAIEQQAIAQSAAIVASADCVIAVVDPTTADFAVAADLRVLNKADLPHDGSRPIDLKIAARTGDGVDELRTLIRRALGCEDLSPNIARCWTDGQRTRLAGR